MRYNLQQIIDRFETGERLKYLFFWGHTVSEGQTTQSCLSQWYLSPFEVDGIKYHTAEHWMMAEKARLFNDQEILSQILRCSSPGDAKKLCRKIQQFKAETWDQIKMDIVVQGSIHKFAANPAMLEFLLATKNRILVEASPVDSIWGIGKGREAQNIENPHTWRGENLLGFALMEARDALLNQ